MLQQKIFPLLRMKWVFLLGLAVVIGGVMSFGAIGVFAFHFDYDTAIYMLGMILPMAAVIGGCIYGVLQHMEKKLAPLLKGFQAVADGNLDVSLAVEDSDEYILFYESFNKMVQELRATKAEMQNFINEFTHEFKTPITSISGFAEYLYEAWEEIDAEERTEYLKVIAEQSRRLSNLSQNALLLSKVEACQIVPDREIFSVSGQIQNCAVLLIRQLEEKHITLDIPEEMTVDYYGNAEMMEQIWINLLGNALKFTPQGGTISVREEQTDTELRIHVRDSGIGMSEETMRHIFDKYYQNDTTSLVKGNGIGLSIARRITELHGGRIEVQSVPDAGSTFTVVLPKINL